MHGGKDYSLKFLTVVCRPQGVLLGIFGGGVTPGSPNPDPISDQQMSFFTPVFRPGLLGLEQKQKMFLQIYFEFAYFSLFLNHVEVPTGSCRPPVVPSNTIPDFKTAQKPSPSGRTIWLI